MYEEFSRARLLRQAWDASNGGPFSEVALVERAASLADEKYRPGLLQVLPAIWLRLDEAGSIDEWLAASGLDGEAIDGMNTAISAGLPSSALKASLHEYALRPQDFPALLFLAFVAARLATPYPGGTPHRMVRDQFWYAPELVIILIRCLPPKLDLLAVEHTLRIILQAPSGWAAPALDGWPEVIGEPGSPYGLPDIVMGLVEFPKEEKKDE